MVWKIRENKNYFFGYFECTIQGLTVLVDTVLDRLLMSQMEKVMLQGYFGKFWNVQNLFQTYVAILSLQAFIWLDIYKAVLDDVYQICS